MLKLENGNAVMVFGLSGEYDHDVIEWIEAQEKKAKEEGLNAPIVLNMLLANAIRKGIQRGA